ncbi:cytochrome P450 736A117 isoform X1 [Arachis duranensis]|nr:cytochrome P450 736A117 isoform X1 [Arachis duranensis]XP_052115556.1 cytochrome P450 736A117 isoform X1 [Arachis duranensis]
MRSLAVLHLLSNKRVQSYSRVREEEAARMVETIKEFASSSVPLNLSEIFSGVTNDIVCRIALGRRYRGGGEGCNKFQELLLEFGELLGTISIGDYIPWLSWLNKIDGSYKRASRVAKRLDEFLDQVIAEHVGSCKRKEQEGLTDNVDDFVDVLLSVTSNAVGFEFDTITMKAILLDMFAAGTDTTYTVLEWAMAELLKRPAVMHKLQDEVRTVVGNRGNITEQDLVHMNYLKAVIKETLRLHPSLPVLVPRESTKGIKLNGYDIEAGTQVLVNAWAVATDPKCWDQPLEFKPERFLNSSVDFKGCDFQFIPFGAGRRGCPGVQFATAVDEIVLATLVHHFDWDLSAASKEVDMSETHGLALHLKSPLLAIATPYYE